MKKWICMHSKWYFDMIIKNFKFNKSNLFFIWKKMAQELKTLNIPFFQILKYRSK